MWCRIALELGRARFQALLAVNLVAAILLPYHISEGQRTEMGRIMYVTLSYLEQDRIKIR